ncbi:ABC transporter substrate-binding protein [Breznakiella homolactica]|uniref:Extracellular solute-binding protein n=1 Tax=Breznakiella homolactica TaxID=2798577 RepID=A0A7T7XN18_9SPIR|nr:extracellular solute-binding protein [Breznakiella homolactica]QQO09369.1 extracellular solute-binding protein [Breznakiella homolactica]
MKKTLWFFVMAAMLFAFFAGCSKSNEQKPQSNEVVIMGNARMYAGEDEAWEELARDFEAETGIKLTIRWQGKWNEVPQNMSAAKLAGEKVDLVTVGAGLINSIVARSGSLMDISELMEPYRSRFKDGMLDSYTIGGRLWGFPYGNSAAGFIYYNKTMFDELGIAPPKTFEELVAASNTIKQKKNIIPLIFRGKDASYWSNLFFTTFAQTTGNKPIEYTQDFLAGTRSFNSPEEIAGLEAIKRFFDAGVLTSDSLDTNGDGMKAAFLQQKAAMMHTHNFQLLQSQAPDFELGILEFPIMVPGSFSQPFGGPGTGIAVPSFADRDNIPNTMKFIEFMLRPENANKVIACYKPVVDVVKGVQVVDDPNVKFLNDVLIPKTVTYLDWIWPAEVNAAVYQVIPAIISGRMTSAQGAQTVQDALDRIIAENDYSYEWWKNWNDSDWKKVTP